MGSAHGAPRSGKRRRWALAPFLGVLAVVVGVGLAPRWWTHDLQGDPARLRLLHAAWKEFTAGRSDRAAAILDRRTAEIAPTALDWMLRARIAESRGRPGEALEDLKHIPDSDSIAAQAWREAGQIELARHRARAAEAAFRRALALNPDQVQSYRELAYIYTLQQRREECDALFRALARRRPLDDVLAFAWCQNFCRLMDWQGARRVQNDFVAADPADRFSRLALAASYELNHQLDEAEATLAPFGDSDRDARAIRIQLALDRGELAAAEDLARGGPTDHVRLNLVRGRLALHGHDPRRAAVSFRAALRQDPEDRDAIQGLSVALRMLDDPQAQHYFQLARRHDRLKQTIQDAPTTIKTDPKLYYKLGEQCESLNRVLAARAWYRLALELDPGDTQAHQALARLDPAAPEGPRALSSQGDQTN